MMNLRNKIIIITTFAIAMGFLESAVVVYLREILYPGGFEFPLSPIPVNLALTELFRELATLIMLLSIGIIAAKRFSAGFAWFIYSFAIWDIFYYVFLKLLLGWPQSVMTWDILFLIPTTWTGPVLSPVLVSLTMILLALLILVQAERGKETRIHKWEWIGFIFGALVLIVGFIFDHSQHMLTHLSLFEMVQIKNPEVLEMATSYIPHRFPWWIFGTGEAIILGTVGIYWRRVAR
ncbi:MAG: hypothetical protein ABFS38_06030, partial [Bacteroidota bacterium]